jgi:murein L,D-transpeptidase YcbB/YkuD
MPASALPTDLGVAGFYASRGEPVIWLKDEAGRAAAAKVSALLRNGSIDGFSKASELANGIDEALQRGQPGDDKIISAAWVAYVRTLNAPLQEVSFGDPGLLPKSPTAAAVLSEAARAPSLSEYVGRVSSVNPLYAALREAALKDGLREDQDVISTLKRLRLLPAAGRAILVDIAAAQLWMIEDGAAIDSMKVVVGKTSSPTPELAGSVHYVTFNPYWHILDEVVQRKVAPIVLKRGVSYLNAARYETVSNWRESDSVDPKTIDWKAVANGSQQVFIRQRPGPNNMMGAVKFSFENDFDIFLHDTPQKGLFAKSERALSLGCVRLEHAERLTKWLLRDTDVPSSDEPEHHVQLAEGVPIFLLNLTANLQDGKLAVAHDADRRDDVATTGSATTADAIREAVPH